MKRSNPSEFETDNIRLSKRSKHSVEAREVLSPSLLGLSDDILLNIFKRISSFDLQNLYLTCVRFSEICCDRTLWNKLDVRDHYLSTDELKEFSKFMQPATKLLAIRGNNKLQLEPCILSDIVNRCTKLKDLIIENYLIAEDKIQIKNFPSTLESLSLKGCFVRNSEKPATLPVLNKKESYLFQIDIHMPNLTCLILSNCDWFKAHSLLVISKIPKLKKLILDSCHSLGECLAYISLATRFGFKSLEKIDLRDTFMGDSEISCFSSTITLQEIYLESPNLDVPRLQPEESLPNEILHVQIRQGQAQLVDLPVPDIVNANNMVYLHDLITDRSLCSLGKCAKNQTILQNTENGLRIIEGDKVSTNNPRLKRIVVRNYSGVTDHTLNHLSTNVSQLEYVDVTGTSVSQQGVENFRNQRPNVVLVSSFDEI